MATVATIYVKLGLDAKDYHNGLSSATKSTQGFGSAMGGIMNGIGKVAMLGLGAVVAGAGAATVALASTVKPASDLQESINALSVTFGDAKDTLLDYSKTAAETVGLSAREFNQLGTVTGAFLQNLGFTAAGAADETITLTERAADMASVFNTDVGTALGAIQSLLKGEFNPIEQFGVKINAAAVEAYALEKGLVATKKELTDNIKAQAALALLYEQTEKVAGDFQNTSEGLANTQRRLAAKTEDLKAKIGTALLPVIEKFANILFKAFDNPRVMAAVDGLISGLGSIGDWIANLADNFNGFQPPEQMIVLFEWLSNWWAINGPGIIAAAQQLAAGLVSGFEQIRAKLEPFIQEVLGKLVVWFTENGPLIQEFAQAIANAFTNFIIPAVVGAVDLILPLLSALIDNVLNIATLIMQVATGDWSGAWETIKTIVQTAIDAVWNFILSAVDKILQLFGTSLPESLQIWRDNFGQLGQIVESAIRIALGWIDKIKSALSNLSLPDWLTPGSPTPLELGLLGINRAMQGIATDALPGLQFGFQALPEVQSGASNTAGRQSQFDESRMANALVTAMVRAGVVVQV